MQSRLPMALSSMAVLNLKQGRASADCMHLGDDRELLHADNIEENASNVLTTLHRFNPALGIRTRAYWSSKGSRNEDSSEWLLLSLVHPLCLVKSVSIRPFRATFQRVHLQLFCHAVFLSASPNHECHCQAMQWQCASRHTSKHLLECHR